MSYTFHVQVGIGKRNLETNQCISKSYQAIWLLKLRLKPKKYACLFLVMLLTVPLTLMESTFEKGYKICPLF